MTDSENRPRNLLDDPSVRRGLRIGGRLVVGWAIFVAVLSIVVITIIVIVAIKIFSTGDSQPGFGNPHSIGVVQVR